MNLDRAFKKAQHYLIENAKINTPVSEGVFDYARSYAAYNQGLGYAEGVCYRTGGAENARDVTAFGLEYFIHHLKYINKEPNAYLMCLFDAYRMFELEGEIK